MPGERTLGDELVDMQQCRTNAAYWARRADEARTEARRHERAAAGLMEGRGVTAAVIDDRAFILARGRDGRRAIKVRKAARPHEIAPAPPAVAEAVVDGDGLDEVGEALAWCKHRGPLPTARRSIDEPLLEEEEP